MGPPNSATEAMLNSLLVRRQSFYVQPESCELSLSKIEIFKPFRYFSSVKDSRILLPTLIAACYQNEHNRAIMEMEMSKEMLFHFLTKWMEGQKTSIGDDIGSAAVASPTENDDVYDLQHRFPECLIASALDYFAL